MPTPQETIIIPQEAIQVLIDALVKFPYAQVAPVLDQYQKLIQEANKPQA
jgi:nitrous oxidase accessory protein NosD